MKDEKKRWSPPDIHIYPCDESSTLGDMAAMTDADVKLAMEKSGFPFTKKFQASPGYLHRKIVDTDMLISIGENIANFNGYVEMNPSATVLWEKLGEACTVAELEEALESRFGIDHEIAVRDVLDFLDVLQEHQMVTVS